MTTRDIILILSTSLVVGISGCSSVRNHSADAIRAGGCVTGFGLDTASLVPGTMSRAYGFGETGLHRLADCAREGSSKLGDSIEGKRAYGEVPLEALEYPNGPSIPLPRTDHAPAPPIEPRCDANRCY